MYAAKHAIVVVEEIVDDDTVRSDPSRTLIPSHAVDARGRVPARGTPVVRAGLLRPRLCLLPALDRDQQGCSGTSHVLKDWVYEIADHDGYLAKLGADYWSDLEVAPRYSEAVNYGSRK